MKKNFIICGLVCVLVLVSSFGITYAYLKSKATAVNIFKVGENKVSIEEPSYTAPDKIYPGLKVNKDPIATNVGNLPCYVRMRVVFSDSHAEDFCNLEWNTGDSSNWKYNENDGYYYYTQILQPDKSTEPLFKSVEILKTKPVTNESDPVATYSAEDIIEFEIIPYAETAQAGNYETYWEAWGFEHAL